MEKTKATRPVRVKRKKPQETAKETEPKTNKYAPKPRIGSQKTVSAPGKKVTTVGLGNLTVETINPYEYSPHK